MSIGKYGMLIVMAPDLSQRASRDNPWYVCAGNGTLSMSSFTVDVTDHEPDAEWKVYEEAGVYHWSVSCGDFGIPIRYTDLWDIPTDGVGALLDAWVEYADRMERTDSFLDRWRRLFDKWAGRLERGGDDGNIAR